MLKSTVIDVQTTSGHTAVGFVCSWNVAICNMIYDFYYEKTPHPLKHKQMHKNLVNCRKPLECNDHCDQASRCKFEVNSNNSPPGRKQRLIVMVVIQESPVSNCWLFTNTGEHTDYVEYKGCKSPKISNALACLLACS